MLTHTSVYITSAPLAADFGSFDISIFDPDKAANCFAIAVISFAGSYPLGVAIFMLSPNMPPNQCADRVKLAEDNGFKYAWITDHFNNRNVYPMLTLISLKTSTIRRGTGSQNDSIGFQEDRFPIFIR